MKAHHLRRSLTHVWLYRFTESSDKGSGLRAWLCHSTASPSPVNLCDALGFDLAHSYLAYISIQEHFSLSSRPADTGSEIYAPQTCSWSPSVVPDRAGRRLRTCERFQTSSDANVKWPSAVFEHMLKWRGSGDSWDVDHAR